MYRIKVQSANFIITTVHIALVINAIFIILTLIVGFCVVKISVDQWFLNSKNDRMSLKDRVLVVVALVITVICCVLFIVQVVYCNINKIEPTEFGDIISCACMFTMANTWVSFAYYQHYQVAKFLE